MFRWCYLIDEKVWIKSVLIKSVIKDLTIFFRDIFNYSEMQNLLESDETLSFQHFEFVSQRTFSLTTFKIGFHDAGFI